MRHPIYLRTNALDRFVFRRVRLASSLVEALLATGDLLANVGLLFLDLLDDLLLRIVVKVIENRRAGVLADALLLESVF